MTTTKKETTDLIELPEMKLPDPVEVSKDINKAFNGIFKKLDDEIEAFEPDLSTTTGRKRIASLAYKISQTKTGLDKEAVKLVDGHKSIVDAVNSERKEMREHLDKKRDEVRKPLTDWEAADEERRLKVVVAFEYIETALSQEYEGVLMIDMNSDQIGAFASFLETKSPCDPDIFLERSEEFDTLVSEKVTSLRNRIDKLKVREAEQAELEELRELKAAKEAAEKAEFEKQEADRKAAEEKALEAKAKELAEAEFVKAIEIAKAEVEAANRREQEAIDAAAEVGFKAQEAAIEAERQAEIDKQAAIDAERERVEREVQAEREAEEKRKADIAHRKAINKEILEEMREYSDADLEELKKIILAIADGHITNVKITY